MSIRALLNRFTATQTGTSPRTGRRQTRQRALTGTCLETLEDRRLLSFDPAVSYAAGAYPQAVATADFNGDGRLDLATANGSGNTVSVLLGNGDGTMQSARSSATGAGPRSIAVGDFDADGIPDLATANAGGDVSVLIGNGDGSFQPPSSTSIGSDPVAVAVGDFNADGTLDLGVASNIYYPGNMNYGYWYPGYHTGWAHVLLGNGDGSFSAPLTSWVSWSYQTSAVAADFNGDGVDDFATTHTDMGYDGYVNVLLTGGGGHPGSGGFASYAVSNGPSGVAAGDFDGDGDTDLATSNQSWGGACVLLGDGGGGFGAPAHYGAVAGTSGTSVALGDFDHDGALDIATANPNDNSVSLLRGAGDGTFSAGWNHAVGPRPTSVAAGDFDDDGWFDLATVNYSAGSASVLMNDGTWPPEVPALFVGDVTVTEGSGGTTAAVFTVTRDGDLAGATTVNYATSNDGALAGSDYSATSGTLVFAAGVASLTITVPVGADLTDEFDQRFYLDLSSASGAVIADGRGTGTIVDDDAEPTVSIVAKVSATEGKKNTTKAFNFAVTLSAASEKEVWVGYATSNGTATTSDADYVAKTGSVYFPPGTTSQTISIVVRGDTRNETNETFFVDLRGATNAIVSEAARRGVGEILNDDGR